MSFVSGDLGRFHASLKVMHCEKISYLARIYVSQEDIHALQEDIHG